MTQQDCFWKQYKQSSSLIYLCVCIYLYMHTTHIHHSIDLCRFVQRPTIYVHFWTNKHTHKDSHGVNAQAFEAKEQIKIGVETCNMTEGARATISTRQLPQTPSRVPDQASHVPRASVTLSNLHCRTPSGVLARPIHKQIEGFTSEGELLLTRVATSVFFLVFSWRHYILIIYTRTYSYARTSTHAHTHTHVRVCAYVHTYMYTEQNSSSQDVVM